MTETEVPQGGAGTADAAPGKEGDGKQAGGQPASSPTDAGSVERAQFDALKKHISVIEAENFEFREADRERKEADAKAERERDLAAGKFKEVEARLSGELDKYKGEHATLTATVAAYRERAAARVEALIKGLDAKEVEYARSLNWPDDPLLQEDILLKVQARQPAKAGSPAGTLERPSGPERPARKLEDMSPMEQSLAGWFGRKS